jgi:alanine racemase
MTSSAPIPRARATIDLDAIRDNVAQLTRRAAPAEVMAVVKADAYGHGLVPAARAAVAGGATWLGVTVIEEALALRTAGIEARILAWIGVPGEAWGEAVHAGVDLSVNAPWAVTEIARAAAERNRVARVHLKADTGLGRAGATPKDWPAFVDAAMAAEAAGAITVVGVWSHLAYADAPGHPTVAHQLDAFRAAVAVAEAAGARLEVRHLANSAATLTLPEAHYDLVRPGLAIYGLSPTPRDATAAQLGLRPAMRVAATVALAKEVGAGQGVSYGHAYITERPTRLALVPIGYADGVPRHASNTGPLMIAGERRTIAGRVCMDQFVVDVGELPVAAGDEVVLFGAGDDGEPTAEDWAAAAGTISYEIVSRVGGRIRKQYIGSAG